MPADVAVLESFPGIGPATARAVGSFAFGLPTVFVETNIRRVFLYFFFRDRQEVLDREILPVVEATLDARDSRRWYYALMDYGAMLKKHVLNPNRRSAHYARQSPFEGSNRQIRGRILKALTKRSEVSARQLAALIEIPADRIRTTCQQLMKDGLIVQKGRHYLLPL